VVVDVAGSVAGPPRRLADQPIAQLAFAPAGLLVAGERGGASLWNS
jgi:hypothetical protein